MAERVEVSARLVDEKVAFEGTAGDLAPVRFDYPPPLGEGGGLTGLQGLLLSFAACSATTVVALLRNAGKTVSGLRVRAGGLRREEHPTCFSTIDLDFEIRSPDVRDADVEKALGLSEASVCPVWALLKGNVEIRTAFSIQEP